MTPALQPVTQKFVYSSSTFPFGEYDEDDYDSDSSVEISVHGSVTTVTSVPKVSDNDDEPRRKKATRKMKIISRVLRILG